MDNIPRDTGAAERQIEAAPLTDRANREPAILRGLTSSEAQLAIFIVWPAWVLVAALVAFLTRIWALGVLIGSLAPMLTIWIAAGRLAKIKRNKPDYYYMHRFRLWLAKNGFHNPFIAHKGSWELGRDAGKGQSKAPKRKG
jgi:conjugative transfer region protein (TIGR03750 family)